MDGRFVEPNLIDYRIVAGIGEVRRRGRRGDRGEYDVLRRRMRTAGERDERRAETRRGARATA